MKQLGILLALPLFVHSQVTQQRNTTTIQTTTTIATEKAAGIQWTEGLSWDQVKEKAQQENKYIFIDCFATWCGPCKKMDNTVYLDESVGAFFNPRFISIRVQMDKTPNDDAFIKSWYKDAETFNETYHIEGFPSYLFMNPQGEIVHKEMGAMETEQFLSLAQTALAPGKTYHDPYASYNKKLADFNNGVIRYEDLPELISVASELGDTTNWRRFVRAHMDHVCELPSAKRYTLDNLRVWFLINPGPDTRLFQLFTQERDQLDSLLGWRGASVQLTDRLIMMHVIAPFFVEQAKGTDVAVTGAYITGPNLKSDNSEADWKTLKKILDQKFDKITAKRNLLDARIEWYNRHHNYTKFAQCLLQKLDEYPPQLDSTMDKGRGIGMINQAIWEIFLHIKDKKLLNRAIAWGHLGLQHSIGRIDLLDTYANLLYKVGKQEEAIYWEEKALSYAKGSFIDDYTRVLEQMKKGEHTYLGQGAEW
jgi:thiol-disulfide isomerase/thioredoxin